MEKTTETMTLMNSGRRRRWIMIMVMAAILRYFIRNTIEQIECNVTAQIHGCPRVSADVILYRCSLQAIVGRSQYCHEESVLMHAIRVEID